MRKNFNKKLMKKVISGILAITLAVSNLTISPRNVEAATTFTKGELNYQVLSTSKLTVEVKGPTDTSITSVEIPETVTNGEVKYTVVSVANNAFQNCIKLEKVEFTDAITSIGTRAFSGCKVLTDVKLPSNLETIGYCCFENCEEVRSITIPKSLKSTTGTGGVSDLSGPFTNCNNLREIKFEKDVEVIAKYLYANCKWLESVEIPNTVKTIEYGAFSNCTNLKSITIPNSVEKIKDFVVSNTPKLESIYMNENIKEISANSFAGADDLSIYLPKYSTSMITFVDAEKEFKFSTTENAHAEEYVVNSRNSAYNVNTNDSYKNVVLNMTYELKSEDTDKVSDMKLVVKVPSTSKVGYIKLDGQFLSKEQYTISSKNLITIPVSNASGKCVVYTTPDENGRMLRQYVMTSHL